MYFFNISKCILKKLNTHFYQKNKKQTYNINITLFSNNIEINKTIKFQY